MRIIGLFILSISLLSCAQNTSNGVINDHAFFNIDQYLDDYFSQIKDSISVSKMVKIGLQEAETQMFPNYDIRKDLKLLRKANISDPSFLDKYIVDSTSIKGIRYTALSEDQKVLSLDIYGSLPEVDSIHATTQIQSMISNQVNTLRFVPNKFFSIKIAEKAVFKDEVENLIHLAFD